MKAFRLFSPTIANKLFFLTVNAVIGIAFMTAFLLYQERNLIVQERQDSVRSAVETASSMLEYYDARVKSNEVSLEEAQQRAKNAIRNIRYGDGEYFWINDMTPKMVMHPIKPVLDNTSLADNKDPTGKRLFVEMVDVVKKNGAGAVFYMWPKPGSDEPVQKVSYVKGFQPWRWIIGSGVYLDSINAAVWQQTKYAALIAVTIGGILLVIGLVVARSVTKPIGEAVKVAQQVASGDLSSHIESSAKDETGQLMQALKEMNEKLANIVRDVHGGTDAIATASSQIAAGNFDLSSRTEAQAGSLEETASAMEQLTSTVKQNADNARHANQLAESAAHIAEKGGQVVTQVVDTMTSINASAKRVSEITSVIDGIAFQTNILALNAAVEAARAGDHGRGFAVVAGEVRSLAQRSAGAAKEIRALIEESVKQADSGSHLVQQAGATMEQIVGSVKQVHGIMMEITAASVEQSHGIEQVNQAIGQMDQVTQQNAALVEQAAAAAGSLQEQATHLRDLVSVFRLSTALSVRRPLAIAAD